MRVLIAKPASRMEAYAVGETRRKPKASGETLILCTTNRSLHLILFPTEACNFRCTYCYEEFRYRGMEPWVVRGVKNLLTRRAGGLGDLWLSWFGGEPLLAVRTIVDILTHAQGLVAAHPDISLRSDMTTNGFLLTEGVFRQLMELGVRRYQISFDGPREWHDRKRILAGGRGTFDRIWENLTRIRDLSGDFSVMIRIHVAEDNLEAMPAFITQCAKTFGPDRRFELFVRGLSRYGGPNDSALPILNPETRHATLEKLRRLASERGAKVTEAPGPTHICYAAHGNSFIVRANGRLNKCTIALEHPYNQVGHIREDGTVEVDSPKVTTWMRGLFTGNPGELACPMKGYADRSVAPSGAEGVSS